MATATEEKKATKKATKAKKSPSKMAKQGKKKTKAEKSEAKKNGAPGRPRKRLVKVGNDDWPAKKVGVLQALQNISKRAKTDDEHWATKPDIAAELEVLEMNDHQVNAYCHELAAEGYVTVQRFEGDPKDYRRTTAKGRKIKLPLV